MSGDSARPQSFRTI